MDTSTGKAIVEIYKQLKKFSLSKRIKIAKTLPKAKDIVNPDSKNFDDTPKLTDKLALLIYIKAKKRNAFVARRMTNNGSRSWVRLVQIKKVLVDAVGTDSIKFGTLANQLLDEFERRSRNRGKHFLNVNNLWYSLEEILERVHGKEDVVISVREKRVWRAYRKRRKKATGIMLPTNVNILSDDYQLVKQIVRIIKQYHMSAKQFMNIHFETFATMNSFPMLKDLVTDKAKDRIELYLYKNKDNENMSPAEKAYWNEVENSRK